MDTINKATTDTTAAHGTSQCKPTSSRREAVAAMAVSAALVGGGMAATDAVSSDGTVEAGIRCPTCGFNHTETLVRLAPRRRRRSVVAVGAAATSLAAVAAAAGVTPVLGFISGNHNETLVRLAPRRRRRSVVAVGAAATSLAARSAPNRMARSVRIPSWTVWPR